MFYMDYSELMDTELNFFHITSYGSHLKKKPISTRHFCKQGHNTNSRFFLVLDGETTFSFINTEGNEKTVTAVQNDIVYLPPDIVYTSVWKNQNHIEYLSAEYQAENADRQPVILNNEIFIIAKDNHSIFRSSFSELCNLYISEQTGYKLKCKAKFYEIFLNIIMENTKSFYKKSDKTIYKSILYIENNFTEDFSVADLAKMSNICESSYRAKFKALKGMSPIEYKNYLRIKKGAELLQSDEYTVSEVAELVNLPDICYFNKLFKRYYGVSPKQIRNK